MNKSVLSSSDLDASAMAPVRDEPIVFSLPSDLCTAVRAQAARLDVPVASALLAAWCLLLARLAGQAHVALVVLKPGSAADDAGEGTVLQRRDVECR